MKNIMYMRSICTGLNCAHFTSYIHVQVLIRCNELMCIHRSHASHDQLKVILVSVHILVYSFLHVIACMYHNYACNYTFTYLEDPGS